jgi:hypothetical protein
MPHVKAMDVVSKEYEHLQSRIVGIPITLSHMAPCCFAPPIYQTPTVMAARFGNGVWEQGGKVFENHCSVC